MNASSNILELPKPSLQPTNTRDWFTYRGREWRIYKRGEKWTLEFEHLKKRYKHGLGEVEKRAAIETAKIKINAVLDGHKETLKASMLHQPAAAARVCTVAQVLSAYAGAPVDLSSNTRRTNINCFKLVLACATGSPADDLSTAILTADTGRLYFESVLKKSRAAADQEGQARAKRSGNSIFNQARSVLRPKLLNYYQRSGLALPDVEPFLKAYKVEKFDDVGAVYDPPADKVLRQTLRDWLKLPRNEFLAVGLMLACGLRKSEVAQVRWGMWTVRNRSPLLDGRGYVKNGAGRFVVPPIDPFWTLLNRAIAKNGWRGQAGELVLQGSEFDLSDRIFRQIGAWLRGLGWTTQKTNHALRAYSGSLVAMKYEVYRASAWLRHASVTTTETFYTHFLNQGVFHPEDVRIRWAK